MTRSQYFIIPSLILLIIGGVIFFYATKTLRKDQTVKSVNVDKEIGFRAEVVILDSLYREYVKVLNTTDEGAQARAESLLNNEFLVIKKQYSGNSSPALLAAKLIRNYEVRVLLTRKLVARKENQSGEISRLKNVIKELEEENQDLKSKNTTIEQLVLSSGG